MIVDAHCHIGQDRNGQLSSEALLRQMDDCGVDKAVVVSVGRFIAVDNREGNDFLIAESQKHPDRFYPMATANPWFGKAATDELGRAFCAGAVGLKLDPALQGFKITDDIIYPLIELAIEHGKPVYLNTGTPVCGMPFQLAELAMRYPGACLIMGHAAFSDFWNDIFHVSRAVENIYFETSIHWPSFIVKMVGEIGSDRILFGSDVPRCAMDLEIEKITRYVQNQEDLDGIFHRTAETLFKELTDEH